MSISSTYPSPLYSTPPAHSRQPVQPTQPPQQPTAPPAASKTNVTYLLAPGLELVTALTFLLNIPAIKKQSNRLLNKSDTDAAKFFRSALPKFSSPRASNLLLVATVLTRSLFNSSVGINQQQAGMVMTNVAALLLNVPLMIMMELATRKHGAEAAHKYSKILALINLMLTGLFTTGFVQKARRDNKQTYYTHDMRNFQEIFDSRNGLSLGERLQLSKHELKSLSVDSVRAYEKSWDEMHHSFGTSKDLKAFLNPVDREGTPGRIAFSAFTMPLGALIALANAKANPKVSAAAAIISIVGNMENGLALALSSWQDKDQPFRWLGVVGGLASPLTEGVLTSKSPLGPAAMTTSNAFQNLYQATAWASKQNTNGDPSKNVVFNKNQLMPPPSAYTPNNRKAVNPSVP